MGASEEISLRPLALRPQAGVNPFASFALGAGMNLKNKATAAARSEEKIKSRGEVTKYARDFLMKFAEVYTRLPTELQFSNLEIVLDPSDPERETQRQLLQRVAADDADERDWRARAPLSAPATQQEGARESQDPNAPKIQRAADLGRTAWAPTAPVVAADSAAQALRKVKGILNKLTPEKFERLLSQLIPLVSSYDVLRGTIRQVFENAVAQPTFVAMYADLCAELDAALPEFTSPEGPQSFKKMLANTCQEEYEATDAARTEAAALTGDERDDAERRSKQRLLGNVRLIAELFKKGMVNDRIMLLILADLLSPSDGEPGEDSIEAACELVATAGAALEVNARSKARLDAAFTHLARLSTNTKVYPSRIRFVIRDLIDLRSQHWVARRETFTAKKLDEIRTEAQAELGIVDVAIPGLEPLIPGMDQLGIGNKRTDDVELFPAFRGPGGPEAPAAGQPAGDGKFSAFLGEFVPLADSNATPPEATGQGPRPPRLDLSDEDRESLGRSLYSDFLSSRNVDEALAAAQELVVPGFGRSLIAIGLDKAFNALIEAERNDIVDVVVALVVRGAVAPNDLRSAVDECTAELEDLALDVPAAPRVLGKVMGLAAVNGLLGLDVVAAQAGSVESAEPRRAYVAEALQAVKAVKGEDGLVEAVKSSGINVEKLLESDPEFEGHLPTADSFAAEMGLSSVM